MYQSSPQGASKMGQKPAMQNAAEASQGDDRFMNRHVQPMVFDGKRMRKAVARKTIDYNSSVVRYLENRKWFKSLNSRITIQPDESYATEVLPPNCMVDNPINAVTTKFVRTSTNKLRCPIFCVVWTPEGRRLVTGASSGEFTLWNGLTFNFETILTAHDLPVRSMVWSHNDSWLLSGDHGGVVKYWQSNMNNVQMYEAHKEAIRGLSFSPTDNKYASCADDGLVKIWDFYRCTEEKILRGHGADVKCIDWHPYKSLLVSGSKDSQQPIKLWDTRTGSGLATLHLHKNTVMSIKWNQNGNWLLTASRDHLLKLFDIRMMKELQSFRGHKREVTAIAWHPIHETLFSSGGSDGAIMFWNAGVEKDVGNMETAHDGMVWSLAWHPLGHILCSGSNDHSSKFWTRNKLGDRMRDKYNLNMQDTEDDLGDDIVGGPAFSTNQGMVIPGMDTSAEPMDYDDEFDFAALPGFRSNQRQNDTDSNFSRSGRHDKGGIPGFSSPPKQLPPFAQPGNDVQVPRFGPGRGLAMPPPFRPQGNGGGFDLQHRPINPGPPRNEQEPIWRPNMPPPNLPFQPRPHLDDKGPPKPPVNWGRNMDNRGPDSTGPGTRGPQDQAPRGPQGQVTREPQTQVTRALQKQMMEKKDGILGSPPHSKPGMWASGPPQSGLGLLGPMPQIPKAPEVRPGILGLQPGKEPNREHELKRPSDRENDRESIDAHALHPNDLSSRGFRSGVGRGAGQRRGNEPNRPPDHFEERGRGFPFQRGFPPGRGGPQGPEDNRRPWQPNNEPSDPRFRRQEDFGHPDRRPHDRPQWEGPKEEHTHTRDEMDFRSHPPPNHHGNPRAGPQYGRGPDGPERRTSDDGKPRPLMSLMSINPVLPQHNRNHELDDPRKRPEESEFDREWDVGPQQKMRFPPSGQPEERRDSREEPIGWRGRGGMR